jgi:hypothetical protein
MPDMILTSNDLPPWPRFSDDRAGIPMHLIDRNEYSGIPTIRKNEMQHGAPEGRRSASARHAVKCQKPEEFDSSDEGARRPCECARALLSSLIIAARHSGLTSLNLAVMQSVIFSTSGTNCTQSRMASDLQASRVASSTSCAMQTWPVTRTATVDPASASTLRRKILARCIAPPSSVCVLRSFSHRIVSPERARWTVHRICTEQRHDRSQRGIPVVGELASPNRCCRRRLADVAVRLC